MAGSLAHLMAVSLAHSMGEKMVENLAHSMAVSSEQQMAESLAHSMAVSSEQQMAESLAHSMAVSLAHLREHTCHRHWSVHWSVQQSNNPGWPKLSYNRKQLLHRQM
jgi:hypothetical protein